MPPARLVIQAVVDLAGHQGPRVAHIGTVKRASLDQSADQSRPAEVNVDLQLLQLSVALQDLGRQRLLRVQVDVRVGREQRWESLLDVAADLSSVEPVAVADPEEVQIWVVGEVHVLEETVLVGLGRVARDEACLREVGVLDDDRDLGTGFEGELALVGLLGLGLGDYVVAEGPIGEREETFVLCGFGASGIASFGSGVLAV